MQEELFRIHHVALAAAREAADLQRRMWESGQGLEISKKGAIDLVTQIDRQSETIIRRHITNAFPDHSVLGEEEGLTGNRNGPLWIVDPLDGTTNFAHGFPSFCVSIAFAVDNTPKVGVVLNPALQEVFSAIAGQGAYRNGKRLAVSKTETLNESLLCTGFAYNVRTSDTNNTQEFLALLMRAQGVRRVGAAALDLAHVACGRFDGFWEYHLNPWDIAAGILLIQEAGGRVSQMDGTPMTLDARNLLVSNGKIHEEMQAVLTEVRKERAP